MKEEFLAVVETKRHLGREFLTWLVHRIEEEGTKLDVEGEVVEVTLGDRVLLAGGTMPSAGHREISDMLAG